MSPGGLLQVHHQKPTVPTAATDKHPAAPPAQPVVMHPPQPLIFAKGPLKKNLFGLPGPAESPEQMAQKLNKGKTVFDVLKMCKTNDVIGTTFKAEDPMIKLKDANTKDTGSGGQIEKGKLKKDLNIPVKGPQSNNNVVAPIKTRPFSPTVSVAGSGPAGSQPAHAKPIQT